MRPALKIILSVLVIIASCQACAKTKSEKEVLIETVSKAVEAAEAKDISAFMKHVSKDYSDDKGNDYNGIKGILFYHLMRPENVKVFLSGFEAELSGDRAVVNSKAFIIRGKEVISIKDILPSDADGLDVSIVFRKENGRWMATGGNWAPVGVTGLL
ncbi:MAG: hypothetical protein HY954_03545 [Deltaproteobacteria bacterium]|nr:hypothetical protein [Deltaproteobacteria bacterium]